jgi:hypothetical protein
VLCASVAAGLGQHPIMAAIGAGVILPYWIMERVSARFGMRGSFAHGLAVGLVGMVVRLAMVLTVLVAIGVFDRPAFAASSLSFLVAYSVYQVVRLAGQPVLAKPASGAASRSGDAHAAVTRVSRRRVAKHG